MEQEEVDLQAPETVAGEGAEVDGAGVEGLAQDFEQRVEECKDAGKVGERFEADERSGSAQREVPPQRLIQLDPDGGVNSEADDERGALRVNNVVKEKRVVEHEIERDEQLREQPVECGQEDGEDGGPVLGLVVLVVDREVEQVEQQRGEGQDED